MFIKSSSYFKWLEGLFQVYAHLFVSVNENKKKMYEKQELFPISALAQFIPHTKEKHLQYDRVFWKDITGGDSWSRKPYHGYLL